MTKVVALQTWSNGSVTMDEKSVLDIDDALATDLIAKGIVADAATYFGGGGSGGLPEVTEADVGKVLTVIITGATKGAVIVPTQMKGIESGSAVALNDVNASLFVNGTKVIFVVNDVDYVETITNGSVTHGDYEIYTTSKGMLLRNNSAYGVSVTVALYVANDVTYGWGAANA